MIITTGGTYRVLAPAPVIGDALSSGGWAVLLVPPVASTVEFYAELAAAAGFPGYFGGNLDALWDSLNDLTDRTALVLERWWQLARAEPRDWPRILAVLDERAAALPPFAVVLA